METTKGTVGWLLKNALAIDMETSINGREIKSWATAIFNIEEERVTENNFGDNADGLKVIIGQTRQNCGLIVGHNIREHDLKTLFGEGDLLNYVLSYTWDTYLIEQCLNPLRPSYALKEEARIKHEKELQLQQERRIETIRCRMGALDNEIARLIIDNYGNLPDDLKNDIEQNIQPNDRLSFDNFM